MGDCESIDYIDGKNMYRLYDVIDYIDQICIDSVDSVCMILIFVRKRTNVWRF